MAKKVLVVDDSITDNKSLCDLLLDNGYEAISAFNGEDGVKMAIEHKPDMVLMDVVMPGMNGFQACKQIVKNEATSSIPVLMISNKHQDTDVLWAEKQGAKGYFAKPVNEKAFFAKVHDLLSDF